ncbi:hypothetical protein H632_c1062p0 [Helicosporidium sp. ATCC 50920]|nr:hypothetical protein H632_c1062p0 [Helicosporidium sp. ATCC 50920]|eukprot:KDD74806.1 hypothetical protein H632_c1062p0 [Helicosporidium sp. ATCC 50920]
MAERQYAIVVFGATGFTGKRIAQEIVKSKFKGSWAIAGRSRSRLDPLAASLEGLADGTAKAPGVVIADSADEASLERMARSARVVISAVGPFRLHGEPVVRACIAGGADYLDVSGEPDFIERVELEMGEAAREAGVYVCSAVGFDSVPGDVGTQHAAALFKSPARCTQVETFISIRPGPSGLHFNAATYESAVLGVGHALELARLRRRIRAERPPPPMPVPGPRLKRRTAPYFDPRVRGWAVPFLGADASVVRRTWSALARAGEPTAHTAVYLVLPSRWYLALYFVYIAVFGFLAQWSWGRSLLLRFPSLFSHGLFSRQGPTEQQMRETRFCFTHIAAGYSRGEPRAPGQDPDLIHTVDVIGPEPAYKACAMFVVQGAVTLLEERGKLKAEPGVHTPGYLFRDTKYVQRLEARGIEFQRVHHVPE